MKGGKDEYIVVLVGIFCNPVWFGLFNGEKVKQRASAQAPRIQAKPAALVFRLCH